jgi:hypothetical protein
VILRNVYFALLIGALAGCSSQSTKAPEKESFSGISVFPGEEIFVSAELIDGKIADVTRASENTNPSKTIIFKFEKSDRGMNLSVKNPFPVAIKYHIDMIDPRGNPHQTSSCPAIAKGGAYEMWPHPIPQLVISNIHAIESGNFSCVY